MLGAENKRKIRRILPGDPEAKGSNIQRMIRVNHAGEYGAKRIYQGQIAVLGKTDSELAKTLQHMADQEQEHLEYFEKEIVKRKVRPTVLQPLWHVAGYALGMITAKMGVKAAMACTVAVETVISDHYAEQIAQLDQNDAEQDLKKNIAKFKAEEEEHHDIGIQHDAEQARGYKILSTAIQNGSKAAIWVAKRF